MALGKGVRVPPDLPFALGHVKGKKSFGKYVMDFDFDTPPDRRNTASMKWDTYKGKDIIPMWVADMDFKSPPVIIEALQKRVDHGVFGYAEAPDELADAVLGMVKTDYDWQVKPEWILWLPGLVTGLNVACRAVGEPGDDVMTAVPAYPPFLTAPENSDRNLITIPFSETSDRLQFDFDRLVTAITPQTSMFILCNPHNPVGRVFTQTELSILSGICAEHDIIICSDEIHCGLILDKDKYHIPTATLSPEIARRTITLMAPSKTYNLPGLGCSFAIISDTQLRQQFEKTMAGIVPLVNAFGFTAALAAYRHGQQWRESLLNYLRTNRDCVIDAIAGIPGLSMGEIEATYLAWIDTRESGIEDPIQFFEDAGVGLSDGIAYGGDGFVRLNFGCPRSTLNEALKRMRQAITDGRRA